MKFLSNIQPRYIIASTVAVALLMVGSAFVELRQSRNELLHVLQEHALSLAEVVAQSSANVVLSTEQIEQQLSERLLNNAYYIARLDSLGLLSHRDLKTFAARNNIYRINIFNTRGQKVLGSHELIPQHGTLVETMSPGTMLRPILNGSQSQLIIGLKQARFEEGQRFAVAIRRTKPGGGAIVLNLDAAELVEFRKRIGIGKLVNDLGDNTGIDYVVIQDRDGVLAATNRVKEMSSIEHDSLLTLALDRDSVITRQLEFNGEETFEVAKRLSIEGSTVGVLRIGLSMAEIRATEERTARRLLIMSIVLAAIGALVFTAIVVNQNYTLVSDKYARIRTFTSNILLNMRDAVVAIDSDERITIFSKQAEELFGIRTKEVAGKKLYELPEIPAKCLSTVFASKVSELQLECTQGRVRTVSVTLSRTTTPDGTLESRTAVIKDLTEARLLEQELQRKGKLTAMGELASGVAHEIRNPLNAISMIAQRYEREFTPRKGLREYRMLTDVLKKESGRVNGIIQQFLSYARPPKLNTSDVSVREFVQHIGTLFGSQAKAKGIRFLAQSDFVGSATLDAEQMTQAILNLLQNALDATPKRGTITFRADRSGNELVFSVADNGAGIAAEKVQRIFDLYFTTKSKGTGMGLAITQRIVSQHGGRIDVTSEPGKGSSFVIRVPVASAEEKSPRSFQRVP